MPRHPSRLRSLPVLAVLLLASGLLGATMTACSVMPGAVAAPALSPPLVEPAPSSTPVVSVGALAPTPTASAAAPAQPLPAPVSGEASKRVVLGYYVPYDTTSWASLQVRANDLDYVSAQWVSVDGCGNVGSKDDRTLIAYANEHGVKVLPSLLTGSGWLNHRLLTDSATTDHYVSEIARYVVEVGYPGFDVDMENINDEDRDAFSAFVGELADALHAKGKILTLAIPAKTTDVRTGWAGPYDYAALGKKADLILLMTYDYSWSSGPPGSIAPQAWVDKVAAYAVSQMPPEKVLIGLAFYGYDWNKTAGGRARALLYSQASALARQYGKEIATDEASHSATFSYTSRAGGFVPPSPSLPPLEHEITVRRLGQCSAKAPPTPTPTPQPTPTPGSQQEHVVWLEDAASVAGKLDVAVRRAVGGVGAWRLGQEDPAVWTHLVSFRSGK